MSLTLSTFAVPKSRTPLGELNVSKDENTFNSFPDLNSKTKQGQSTSSSILQKTEILQDLSSDEELIYSVPIFHKNMNYKDLIYANLTKNNVLVESRQTGSVLKRPISKLAAVSQQSRCNFNRPLGKFRLLSQKENKRATEENIENLITEEIQKLDINKISLDSNQSPKTFDVEDDDSQKRSDDESTQTEDDEESSTSSPNKYMYVPRAQTGKNDEQRKVICLNSLSSNKQNIQLGGFKISLSNNVLPPAFSFKGRTIKAII